MQSRRTAPTARIPADPRNFFPVNLTQVTALALMLLAVILLIGCTTSGDNTTKAQQQAQTSAQNNVVYIPQNHVEQANYNERQKRADNPNTILWCTSAFSTQGSPIFTVPIIGKLTSGSKRPIPTSQAKNSYQDNTTYSPETPGPDGMYGTSSDFRYGFSPNGAYNDFYGIETFCTDQPTTFQKENTKIVSGTDPDLYAAQQAATKVLTDACGVDATGPQNSTAACAAAEVQAQAILNAAIVKAGGK